MASTTISAVGSSEALAARCKSSEAWAECVNELTPSKRCSAATGALVGMILGAGFWVMILAVFFKH